MPSLMQFRTLAPFILVLTATALAQDFRATVSGRVTDSSGLGVPQAKVTVTQKSSGQATIVATNPDGYYTAPYLQPSVYDIEVSAQGFNNTRRQDVTLLTAQKAEVGFQLTVGAVSESVTVTAGADVVESSDASGGLNFDAIQASEYALNGRQVYMLMDLTPGVLFTQESFGQSGFSGTRGWDTTDQYVMSGGVRGTNSFSLNGAPISLTGQWQVAPNMEAIQEFKVMVNTYDAAIGRTGGGSVNTTLKSGGNAWHGSLFDYIRNSRLDSNYTQNNRAGQPLGKHITNQFGGTVGGPIRKGKDYIFASFEGFRELLPSPVTASVPPLDLRDGQHFTKYGMNVFDPLTGHNCVSNVDVTGSCRSTYIRNPFPGNAIPTSRMSPIGARMLSYYPSPNVPNLAANIYTNNLVLSNNEAEFDYNQPIVRWDRTIDDNNRFNAVFTWQLGHSYRNTTGIPFPAIGGDIHQARANFNIITNYTRIISPTTVFDVRASFGRFTQTVPCGEIGAITAKDLGMTGHVNAPRDPSDFPPYVAVDQFASLFCNPNPIFKWTTDNQWNVVPTLTHVTGKRTVKIGADVVYALRADAGTGYANGNFSFNRYGTQQYPLSSINNKDGAGIADLMLGIPGTGFVDSNDTYYRTWPYYGLFLQNDWKVRHNLTLNLGLRYDIQFPLIERWNRVNSGFDFNAVNPDSAAALANWSANAAAYNATNPKYPYPVAPPALLGGKTFIKPGDSRRIYDTDWQDIQPRVGLAWQFLPKTVLRTGAGIFHRTATQNGYSDGYSLQTPYQRSINGDITPSAGLTGPYSMQDLFPNGLQVPAGSSLGLLTNVGNSVSFDGRQRVIPRTFQYSFGLQRQVWGGILLDASYVGSYTTHETLTSTYNLDALPYSMFQQCYTDNSLCDRTVNNPFYGVVPATTSLGSGKTIAAKSLMAPYPLFNSGVSIASNPWAHYRYDSLQLKAVKRFTGDRSKGGALTLVFGYSFSKNFQDANFLNVYDAKPVHELVSYDKPQNVSLSGVWDLPVGRGRHFLSGAGRAVDSAIGGWSMHYVFTYRSGNPIGGIDAMNYCGTLLVADQTKGQWFNNDPSCYKNRQNYTLRNVPDRYAWLRQMDNTNVNLALAKTFTPTERVRFSLRGEAFNLMNHPLYGAPSTSITSATFGQLPSDQQNFPRIVQISARLQY
jgi:hypothetical protein